MSNLVRWNPLHEMAAMQRAMDRLFEDAWRDNPPLAVNGLALDVNESDNAYTVSTEMPGVNPDDIRVRLDGDLLTIEGEFRDEHNEEKEGRTVRKERRYGRFNRSIRLPHPVKEGDVEAHYENGVLKLVLPKSEAAQPKLIPVKTSNNGG